MITRTHYTLVEITEQIRRLWVMVYIILGLVFFGAMFMTTISIVVWWDR